jgi:hypothetical protein
MGRSIDIERYKLGYCLRADCITYTLTNNQRSWNRQITEYGSYILSSIRVQAVYSGYVPVETMRKHIVRLLTRVIVRWRSREISAIGS